MLQPRVSATWLENIYITKIFNGLQWHHKHGFHLSGSKCFTMKRGNFKMNLILQNAFVVAESRCSTQNVELILDGSLREKYTKPSNSNIFVIYLGINHVIAGFKWLIIIHHSSRKLEADVKKMKLLNKSIFIGCVLFEYIVKSSDSKYAMTCMVGYNRQLGYQFQLWETTKSMWRWS